MSALVGYYEAMANDRNAAADLARAQAAQVGQQTQQVADDSAAKRGSLSAEANLANQQAAQVAPTAQSEQSSKDAQTALARDRLTPYNDDVLSRLSTALPGQAVPFANTQTQQQQPAATTTGSVTSSTLHPSIITSMRSVLDPDYATPRGPKLYTTGYEKGGVVKKTGNPKPGKSDKIPALLAPGEAILNAGAVKHVGVSTIHHMNKMGLLRTAAEKEVHEHLKAIRGHSLEKAVAARKQGSGAGRNKAAG